MGATTDSLILYVDTSKSETIRTVWNKHIEELHYDYGHDCYNGTFTTCEGLSLGSLPEDIDSTDESAIFEYLWDNTEKWGNALAVKVLEKDGIETWLVGGIVAE